MKFVDVKNEVAFRKVFGNEKKKQILISFLNAILGLDAQKAIKEVSLLNPFRLPRLLGDSPSRLDILATDVNDVTSAIELQVVDSPSTVKNALFSACKNYTGQVKVGANGIEDSQLLPVYFIGILDFPYFSGKNFISSHILINEETGENVFKDVKLRFVDLKKFAKKSTELKGLTDKWVFFLKNSTELEAIPADVDDAGLKAAYEEATQQSWSKNEFEAYSYVNDDRSRFDKEKADMILGMKAEGLTNAKIAKIAKVDEATVAQVLERDKRK